MLIGVRKRFVFVANSKSASTSIERALVNHAEINRTETSARKHIGLAAALEEYDFLFGQPAYRPDTFFKFGVLRDPIDWIGSWYRYRRGNDVANPLPGAMSFAEFWHRKDWNIQNPQGARFLQSDVFRDGDGNVQADYIIPFDDIDAHFSRICAAIDVPDNLPRKNMSKLRAIDGGVDPELEAEMREFYAADYALLDRIEEINATGIAKLDARAGDKRPR